MPAAIEEVSDREAALHYVDKAWDEFHADVGPFLEACVLKAEKELGPDRRAEVAELVRSLAASRLGGGGGGEGGATGSAVPPPAEALAAEAVPAGPASPAGDKAEAQAEASEVGPSSGRSEAEEADTGDAAPATKLPPNAGNGADLERYSWTQTLGEVVVTFPVPKGTRGRGCEVTVGRTRVLAGVRGDAAGPALDGELYAAVQPDESLWSIVDGSTLELTLTKADQMAWWPSVLANEPESRQVDVSKVEPENSQLGDLDPETRATVEKMMWDQRQKQLGLPTSDEQARQDALARFMSQHPEMDFSNAKIM